MTAWFAAHPWITYAMIFVLIIFVFNNVFRVQRLPILKEIVIHLLLALGSFILLLFQVDLELPIVYSLIVAVALILIVRIRAWLINRSGRKS